MKYLVLLNLICLVYGSPEQDLHDLCFKEYQTEFNNFNSRQGKQHEQCSLDHSNELKELQSYFKNSRYSTTININNLVGTLKNCSSLEDTVALFECIYEHVSLMCFQVFF